MLIATFTFIYFSEILIVIISFPHDDFGVKF